MTLGFWYLFQEALWSTDYYIPEGEEQNGDAGGVDVGADAMAMAKAVYSELVKVLRRKVAFPGKGITWSKGSACLLPLFCDDANRKVYQIRLTNSRCKFACGPGRFVCSIGRHYSGTAETSGTL